MTIRDEAYLGRPVCSFVVDAHTHISPPYYMSGWYAADFADEKVCVVLTHTWGGNPPLSEVEELAGQHPRMKLMCTHQGGGYADLSYALVQVMKRQPNLYMEICGSLTNPLSMEDLVEMAGEDHVIYGSDLINLDVRYDVGRVVFSPLSDAVKKKLLSGNFLSLLAGSQMGRIMEPSCV